MKEPSLETELQFTRMTGRYDFVKSEYAQGYRALSVFICHSELLCKEVRHMWLIETSRLLLLLFHLEIIAKSTGFLNSLAL